MKGTQERAELVANVDELMDWKRLFEHKQIEMIKWQTGVMTDAIEVRKSLQTVIQGCTAMMECDMELGKRLDVMSERIDIANKRIRVLENAK